MNNRRRVAALAVSSVVLGAVTPGCPGWDDWRLTNTGTASADQCCGPALPQYFECLVAVDTTGCDPIETTCPSTSCPRDSLCDVTVRQCFADEADAVKQARAFAQSAHKWATVDWCATPRCTRVPCGGHHFTLLDHQVCGSVAEADAGPPAACLGVGGACGDCMNASCCAQVAACGDDADCASVLAYWVGAGPQNGTLDAPATALSECLQESCNDACSPYFGGLRHLDGGAW